MRWWKKHIKGIFSKQGVSRIARLLQGKPILDEKTLLDLKKLLIEADLGLPLTERALKQIHASRKAPYVVLQEFLESLLPKSQLILDDPLNIVLIVGVNGVGKTTTIAKLLHYFKGRYRTLVASGDTYRAAAEDQLSFWAKKTGVEIVESGNTKDPAAVMYDAVKTAINKGSNLLIVDTAGRMHGNQNLIDQLKKMKRICKKVDENLSPKVWLVLDGSLGQSNQAQAWAFHKEIVADGIILTKLDGVSKGGSIFSIADRFNLPVYFLGVGESLEDLIEFDRKAFVEKVLEY